MSEPLTLKEHQEIMLQMLKCFDCYCKEHNLRYSLAYGTLLGAVRHHGIIPWDDDTDIWMPRPDYEKLLSDGAISEQYQIVSFKNQGNYWHPLAYANIIDKKTIMKENFARKSTNQGVFIDIFPLDGAPDSVFKRKIHMKRLALMNLLLCTGFNRAPGFGSANAAVKTILNKLISLKTVEKLAYRIDKLSQKFPYEQSKSIICGMIILHDTEKSVMSKDNCKNYIDLDYEGLKLKAFSEYDEILRKRYNDYMQVPPESERQGHHGLEIYYRQKSS